MTEGKLTIPLPHPLRIPSLRENNGRFAEVLQNGNPLSARIKFEIHLKENDLQKTKLKDVGMSDEVSVRQDYTYRLWSDPLDHAVFWIALQGQCRA